jgi:hypothetical protein
MNAHSWPFVARQDEQERFAAALVQVRDGQASDAPSHLILVEGLGGYGKSSLLQRYAAIATGRVAVDFLPNPKFRVVAVDWQEQRDRRPSAFSLAAGPQILTVLLTLHGEIRDAARHDSQVPRDVARAFQEFTRAAQLAPELAAIAAQAAAVRAEAANSTANRLDAAAAIGTTLAAVSPMPLAAPLVKPIIQLAAARPRRAANAGSRVDEAFRLEENLVRLFADGLRQASHKAPIVLLLDTYEIVAAVGPWLRQVAQHTGAACCGSWPGGLRAMSCQGNPQRRLRFGRKFPKATYGLSR